jgi:TPR repeat protein
MYNNGEGVTQDYKEAEKWYRLAAEQGDPEAQYNLGVMYDTGKGVTQDFVRAHMWFNIVAGNGIEEAKKYREIVANEMTPTQIADAERMARDCEKKKYKSCE